MGGPLHGCILAIHRPRAIVRPKRLFLMEAQYRFAPVWPLDHHCLCHIPMSRKAGFEAKVEAAVGELAPSQSATGQANRRPAPLR